MNDIIVQFAILWGEHIGSALSSKELEISNEMKAYDSKEVLHLLSAWAEEYMHSEITDTVEFFDSKLTDLMHE